MKTGSLFPARILHFLAVVLLTGMAGSCFPKAAGGEKRPRAATPHTLRVMTYNIHHCNPPSKEASGEIDLEAIVMVIRREAPDLVALQEVDVYTSRSGPVNQATEIARRLGMKAFFGKAIDYGGGAYGVAILSRYPLADTVVVRLPAGADPKSEARVLAMAKVTLPQGTVLRFGTTHLDVRNARTRESQVREIVKVAAGETLPFIVAGDFNAAVSSPAISLLDEHLTRTCQQCEPTIPVLNPNRAIDFIAYTRASPFRVLTQKVVPERYASDHLPVVADLAYGR